MSDWKQQVDHLKDRQSVNSEFLSELVKQKSTLDAYGEKLMQRLNHLVKLVKEADDEIESLESQVMTLTEEVMTDGARGQ